MSGPGSQENQEGSYSMYPPTSPVAPPGSAQHNMGMYVSPAAFAQYGYGYPVPMDIYAGQGAPFLSYGMNPNMVYYGGSVPQPTHSKKKYYNNKMEAGPGRNESPNQYFNGPKPTASSNSSTTSSTPVPQKVPITIKNQYKFEMGNSNSFNTEGLKLEYPFFVNTNEQEYAEAKALRYRIKHRSSLDLTSVPSSRATGEQEVSEVKPVEEANVEDIKKLFPKQNIKTETESPAPQTNGIVLERKVPTTESSVEPSSETNSPGSVKAVKSWSAVASSAAPKGASSQPLAEKDKKYVPSTIKGLESLGLVSLRICFDNEYVKMTTKSVLEDCVGIWSVIPRGIVNSGNICFMSSILQVLLICQPFVDLLNIIRLRTPAKVGSPVSPLLDACLGFYSQFDKETMERRKAVDEKAQDRKGSAPITETINPEEFYKAVSKLPKFKDLKWGHQEDAEEFLTHFLDQLHEEFIKSVSSLTENDIWNLIKSINDKDIKNVFIKNLLKYKGAEFIKNASTQFKEMLDKNGASGNFQDGHDGGWHEVSSSKKGKKPKTAAKRTMEVEPSPITSIFGGQFRSVLDIPQSKEQQSITLDPFQTLQLDISDPEVNDLESALSKFNEPELIPFKTSTGQDVEAKKQTFIDKLPNVFLIQLKRFSFVNNTEKNRMVNYNAYSGRVEKIHKKINYSHVLNLPTSTITSTHPCVNGQYNADYKLIGVVYHHGISSSGGHYTCDVYYAETAKWFRIDDVTVTEIGRDDVLTGGEDEADSRTAYILMYQKL
ncbi:LAMI_0H12156g1_1 [Lachancea mirantina]|uniref:Ubiquitin carboxyl-terminal hydrolase n=1 Tax=Lachancea mirantina TaxID=1230905 RepID=A0A1G4KHK3_9SACH|nr:LAMI_0H12156g1_1 [Lachancea mirantina]